MPTSIRLTRPTALVLVALARGLRHGFDIIDATDLPSGTVYPILHRCENAGLVRARWEPVREARTEQRPPRRYYELTGAGADAVREALALHPGIRIPKARTSGSPVPSPA
jgi:PadR family transcriptional regulator, regulatory protein PadR